MRVPWAKPQRNALEGRNALDRHALEHMRNYKARWRPPCLKSKRWLRRPCIAAHFYSLGDFGFLSPRMMAMKCGGTVHVLQTVQRACPNQACSLQGSRDVSCDSLAANDLGTGSGWQQSRQNWALLAVVG